MALDEESGYSPQAKVNNVYFFKIILINTNKIGIPRIYILDH